MGAAITIFDQTPIGRCLESHYGYYRLISPYLKTQSEEFVNGKINVEDDTIFNGASSVYFRSGFISEQALRLYQDREVKLKDLCKQHRYPRRLSTKYIFENICDWTIDEFRDHIKRLSVYDLTLKEENIYLIPFQKEGIFDMDNPLEPYKKLKMKMIECDSLKGKRDDDQLSLATLERHLQ